MLDKSEQATSSTDKPNYEVHGTKLLENSTVNFWKKQNMGFIKDSLLTFILLYCIINLI